MKILITAGLGDFIAIESWLPANIKQSVLAIYWATRAKNLIKQAIDIKHIFPNFVTEQTLHDNWCSASEWTGDLSNGRPFCITCKEQLAAIGVNIQLYTSSLNDIYDLSVMRMFGEIEKRNWSYQNSTFITRTLANISHIKLPNDYICIHPFSDNAAADHRDFDMHDWKAIVNIMITQNKKLVVIGTGRSKTKIPKHPNIINLIDKTTIAEAIEITKHARAFIGSASIFSVIASKALDQSKVFIKGHKSLTEANYWIDKNTSQRWRYPLWKFYYSPLTDSKQFLHEHLNVIKNVTI